MKKPVTSETFLEKFLSDINAPMRVEYVLLIQAETESFPTML